MTRQRIEIERAGLRTPRERMWEAARKLRRFTRLQLQDATQPLVPFNIVHCYLQVLHKAGFIAVEKPDRDIGETQVYVVVRDSWEAPRIDKKGQPVVQGLALLAMWRAMKALKDFDYHDISRAASVGEIIVKPATAKSYVNQLSRAGYFRSVRESKPGTPARYRLVRDTGAHAPAITRRKCVFDRNLGEFTLQESAQEVCDGLD